MATASRNPFAWPTIRSSPSTVALSASRPGVFSMPTPIRRRARGWPVQPSTRSEEHTSELQSLMRISYAVFCLKKKINKVYYRRHKLPHPPPTTPQEHTYLYHATRFLPTPPPPL